MGVGDKWESTQRQDEGRKDIKFIAMTITDDFVEQHFRSDKGESPVGIVKK